MIGLADAHYHLNMKSPNPVLELVELLRNGIISKCVLILNNEHEMECTIQNFSLIEKYTSQIHIAILLDPHDVTIYNKYKSFFDSKGISTSIKIHPRLSNICKNDFELVKKAIEGTKYKNILVDGLFYGTRTENFVSIELSIFLAKKFPETKVILCHFGGHKVLEAMLYTRELNNVYYDISCSVCYFRGTSVWQDLSHAVKFNSDRVMLGSDYPMFSIETSFDTLKDMVNLYEEESYLIKKVAEENIMNVFFSNTMNKNEERVR